MKNKYEIFQEVLNELEQELDMEGRELETTSKLYWLADEKAGESHA